MSAEISNHKKTKLKISTSELCYLVDIVFNIPEIKQRLRELGAVEVNVDDLISDEEGG